MVSLLFFLTDECISVRGISFHARLFLCVVIKEKEHQKPLGSDVPTGALGGHYDVFTALGGGGNASDPILVLTKMFSIRTHLCSSNNTPPLFYFCAWQLCHVGPFLDEPSKMCFRYALICVFVSVCVCFVQEATHDDCHWKKATEAWPEHSTAAMMNQREGALWESPA